MMDRKRLLGGGACLSFLSACGLGVVGTLEPLPTDAGVPGEAGSIVPPVSRDDAGAQTIDAALDAASDVGVDVAEATEPFVTISSAALPATANLSEEGTLDWIDWNGAGDSTRKAPVTNLIGALSRVGTTSGPVYPCTFSWTDGQTSSPGPTKYEYFTGGGSVAFDVAASAKPRILTLYFGAYFSQAQLTVTLSDGPQTASDTMLDNPTSSIVGRRFVVTYAAKSSAAKLRVDWSRIKSYDGASTFSVAGAALRE